MIVPKSPQVLRMVRYVGLPLLLLALWDLLVVLAFKVVHWEWIGSRNVPLALYGSVIGLIVGFRNNSAYARWWEGRQLWGQIVNNSRSLARQVCAVSCVGDEARVEDFRRSMLREQIAYVHCLRQQLRSLDAMAEARRHLSESDCMALEGQKNLPLGLQRKMAWRLLEAKQNRWIDSFEWQAMDRNLDDLADAQGGTERIKNTPLPKQYDFFPMLFVEIYCVLLPIGMVENLGWFTPVGSTIVGFMFLALDKIGRDLENPFDNTIYDVPMTSIARTIEINLLQMLGEKNIPEPEKPSYGVLW